MRESLPASVGGINIGWPVVLTYVALIVYASLFPLTGWRVPADGQWDFLTSWPGSVSRADVVSNIVAYVPLGLLLVWRVRKRMPLLAAIVAATAIGTLLSVFIECVQTFLPSRSPSALDILNNALGTLIGACAAAAFRGDAGVTRWLLSLRSAWFVSGRLADYALLAVLLWILSQWSPFVPSLDMSSIKEGLMPLWRMLHDASLFRPHDAAAYVLNILGLGLLAGLVLKPGRPLIIPYAALVGGTLLPKVVIVGRQLSPEALCGYALGIAALSLLNSMPRSARIWAAACALLGGFAAAEIAPGTGASVPFNWIPFVGEIENNINGFANIMAAVWPFLAAGCLVGFVTPNYRKAEVAFAGTLVVVACVFLLEWIQTLLPGRHGDLTTVLLATGGWLLSWQWREPKFQAPRRNHRISAAE